MTRKFAGAVAAIFWFIITAIRIADLSPIGLFAAVQSGALVALLCGNPSNPNLFLFVTITGACIFRALAEETRIAGYANYTASVRWRMLPGVW